MVILSLREKVAPRVYELGLGNYIEFFNEPIYWNTLIRTGSMSLLVTVLSLIIGFPIAYYIAKIAGPRMRGALFLVCLIPLWVSDLIRAFGWILLLRETGVVSNILLWAGLVDAPVEMLLQRHHRGDRAGLYGNLVHDRAIGFYARRHGRHLDRSRLQSRRARIYSPQTHHHSICHARHRIRMHHRIHADCGSYLTPILLGGKNSSWFTEQIYDQFITRYNWESGAAFGMLLLAFTSLVVWLGLRLTGQSLANTVTKA